MRKILRNTTIRRKPLEPADIHVVMLFGKARPALVIWVDDAADSCLICPVTSSTVIQPVYPLPKLGGGVYGAMSALVTRMPVSSIRSSAVCTVPDNLFDDIVTWLRAEISI